MADQDYSRLQRLAQRLVSYKWVSLMNAKYLPYLDRAVFKLTRGRYTMTSLASGLPLVMVHTIGAKSGLKRSIPLLCIRGNNTDSEFAIVASNWGQAHLPAWYYNLKANPQVDCTIRGVTHSYIAMEAEGDDYRYYWSIAENVYMGFPKYRHRAGRHIPIMMMTPTNP